MAATTPLVRFLTATFLLEDFKRDLLLCIIRKERRPMTESAVTAAPVVVASAAIAGCSSSNRPTNCRVCLNLEMEWAATKFS